MCIMLGYLMRARRSTGKCALSVCVRTRLPPRCGSAVFPVYPQLTRLLRNSKLKPMRRGLHSCAAPRLLPVTALHFFGRSFSYNTDSAGCEGTPLVTPCFVKSTVDTCAFMPKMLQTFSFLIV